MEPTPVPLLQLLDLSGRTAIVTGAGMGIGQAIARRLAEAGAAVVIADADAEAAESTAKELRDAGLEARAVHCDVSVDGDVQALVHQATAWHGSLDVLVNNAGIFPITPVLDMTPAQFDHVLAVNLRGTFLCSKYAALRMRQQGKGGRIVNVTSIDALHPAQIGLAHYDASKHGVWGFTKNLALELAPYGIQVNAVAPGGVSTPGVAHMTGTTGSDLDLALAGFAASIPLQRLGAPDDIARMVLVLTSDLSSYMTGSQVVVDGGALLT